MLTFDDNFWYFVFTLLSDEVAKSLDKIDGVVDHGVISKFP